MKPTHYSVSDDQYNWLRDQAHQHNTTQAAIVRLAVDRLINTADQLGEGFLATQLAQREGAGS